MSATYPFLRAIPLVLIPALAAACGGGASDAPPTDLQIDDEAGVQEAAIPPDVSRPIEAALDPDVGLRIEGGPAIPDAGPESSVDSSPDTKPPPTEGGACSPVADLLADNNRNGVIDVNDPTERANKGTWDQTHGAIFLANIDDDSLRCPKSGTDVDLAACNDATDEIVNGADDALDLAPLRVGTWPCAPDGAEGSLSTNAPAADKIRLFVKDGATYKVFNHLTDKLSAAQLRAGVELALEGKDIVRDSAVWDGFVDLTLTVSAPGVSAATDVVKLRVAPLISQHHLLFPETLYAASFRGASESQDFITDLRAATTAAGVTLRLLTNIDSRTPMDDQWTQDIIEAGYATMPSKSGIQGMHIAVRSANVFAPRDTRNPLRPSGKVVFTQLRGKDMAGVAQYDVRHSQAMDTLDSFGNLETIPPYTHAGESYPLGRVIRGSTASYHPDHTMLTMFESQKVQPPVYVDTSWLLVGHVDETLSFVKGPAPRGWVMLANDPALAKKMMTDEVAKGNGAVKMFEGVEFIDNNDQFYPAAISIADVLADPDLMAASAEAAVEVDNQIGVLKQATGITDSEIVSLPFLQMKVDGSLVAYQPGTVNGISLGDNIWAAPKPHGPLIGGKDMWVTHLEGEMSKLGITVKWVENWYLYHILEGEIHCGSSAVRRIPSDVKWWESGR